MNIVNQRLKTKDAAKIIGVDVHTMKPLREYGFLVGTKIGKGYMYDAKELEMFIELTRGYDLSNPQKIAVAAGIIQPYKKMPHPRDW